MIKENLRLIQQSLPDKVTLIAVSKTHPVELIREAYEAGQRHFGENKVQEMMDKKPLLPDDVKWHLIGHLQSNKVKYIAPFVHLIHSVDSLKLLIVINKEAAKNNRVIDCLLQIHISTEETKFGLDAQELTQLLDSSEYAILSNIRVCGLMGMASFSDDLILVRNEFRGLNNLFQQIKSSHFHSDSSFSILSMGMSGDYVLAVEEGSNMVRVGSSIFGQRVYNSE